MSIEETPEQQAEQAAAPAEPTPAPAPVADAPAPAPAASAPTPAPAAAPAERPRSEGGRPEGGAPRYGGGGGERGGYGRRPGPGGPGGRPGGPRRPRRKVCNFCVEKGPAITYKDVARLRRFVSERGKILPRRTTGTCAIHQRALARAVKRAREIALMPFVAEQ